jgi:hypothetical protein
MAIVIKKRSRARRIKAFRPYEIGAVPMGANKREYCVIKSVDGAVDSVASIVSLANDFAKLSAVMKSAESMDAAATTELNNMLSNAYYALGAILNGDSEEDKTHDPAFMNNLKTVELGLQELRDTMHAEGIDLALVDRVGALQDSLRDIAEAQPMSAEDSSSDTTVAVETVDAKNSENEKVQQSGQSDQQEDVAKANKMKETDNKELTDKSDKTAAAAVANAVDQVAENKDAPVTDNQDGSVTKAGDTTVDSVASSETNKQESLSVTKADMQDMFKTFQDMIAAQTAETAKKIEESVLKSLSAKLPGSADPTGKTSAKFDIKSNQLGEIDMFDLASSPALKNIKLHGC